MNISSNPLNVYKQELINIEKISFSLLYSITLLFLYKDSVYPSFGYMGFPFYGINWLVVSCQLAMILVVSVLIPADFNKISDLCSWLLFKMVFIPTLVIAGVVVHNISMMQLLMTDLILVVCMLSIILVSRSEIKCETPTLSPALFWIFLSSVGLVIVSFIIVDFGFSLGRLLDLRNYSEIYDIRYAHRDASESASFVSNYGLLWLAKVIVPLFWGWGLYRKSRIVILSSLTLQLCLFAISAHKSFLFGLVFVYFIYWIATKPNSGLWFQRCIVGFTLFAAALFYLLDFSIPVSVIVRRVFIVPGMLSGFFVEFYSNNPLALYAHNFLSGLVSTGYTSSPAFTVGQSYFGRAETSANVNFWGDAFGNLGYFGLIFITTILNITLLVINALSYKKNLVLGLCMFSVCFWTITETSLTTTFVSHGLTFAILLLALKNRETSVS